MGCCIETDDAVPQKQSVDVESKSPEKHEIPQGSFEDEDDSGICDDAYQIIVLFDQSTRKNVIILVPIPCDSTPYIDLGRPAPMTL